MSDPRHSHHEHHEAHPPADAPAEPGYPEHPELAAAARVAHGEHAGHAARTADGGHAAHDGHPAHDEHAGHDRHEGHSAEMFRRKFWGTLALTIPTVAWAPMVQQWLGYRAPVFPGSRYIPAVFGTLVFLYGGLVFLRGARHELADRRPGMMTLISLAILVSFIFSLAVTLGYPGMDFWWELASLITIMVLGHWIEMRSISQAQGALKELAKLLPDVAVRVTGDRTEEVPVSALREGDVVLVRPGASVPADGLVREGRSAVNESMISGESRPVEKETGAKVIAGTVNGAGSLRVEVTGTGERTALAGIMRLVAQAQSSRSNAQALADRAAFLLTIVAIAAGALTLIVWLAVGADPSFAIERTVTVLVIACPHALGLAIPLVIAISTTLGARNGLLVRDRRGLEEARNLDAVFFDKTGTLTRGEFRVVEVTPADGLAPDDALAIAAAVEHDSEHTIAQGIVKSAAERGVRIPAVREFEAIPGRGVRARLDGHEYAVGGPALLTGLGVSLPPELSAAVERAAGRGQSAVTLVEDGREPRAVLAVADAVREESREAVQRLHDEGMEVIMMTGDSAPVASAVARELDIDTVLAGVLPGQKASKIEEARRQGKRVAMVGDGVNDAPALVTANVGIAIGAGTDVAVEAGDVVLVRSDPRDVPRIIALSRATYRKMVQNLWWAAGYNIVAIPLAAGVLAPWGIVLHPAVGAVLMSLSTIIVALNAQLLRRARL
ncbi:MAG TPA: heavy metal translocating P-type ATPase [Gemmatimonadaceae bacterium]|nr:heavy metal translocating P-type ATPase [Gemmatimonadaceae bacterium]